MLFDVTRFFIFFLVVSACSAAPVEPAPNLRETKVEEVAPPKEIAPPVQPKSEPRAFRVAVVSDLNSSYGSLEYTPEVHETVRWLSEESRPDLVLSTGDMVAGMRRGLDYRAMWDSFLGNVVQPLDPIPFLPTPGNHDGAPNFAEEREEYLKTWTPRKPELNWVSDESWPTQYAFRFGGVLFISLDFSTVRWLDEEERVWLEDLLKDSERSVIFTHVPLHPIAAGRSREATRDRALEELLRRYPVTLIHGHHHAYFRHRHNGISTISMPCLGTGARKLQGQGDAAENGVVILEFDDEEFADTLVAAPSFETRDLSTLPSTLDWEDSSIELYLGPLFCEARTC